MNEEYFMDPSMSVTFMVTLRPYHVGSEVIVERYFATVTWDHCAKMVQVNNYLGSQKCSNYLRHNNDL